MRTVHYLMTAFADETLLQGSQLSVDTNDHAVEIRGTVLTTEAKARAVAIARGTERVTGVVDLILVE